MQREICHVDSDEGGKRLTKSRRALFIFVLLVNFVLAFEYTSREGQFSVSYGSAPGEEPDVLDKTNLLSNFKHLHFKCKKESFNITICKEYRSGVSLEAH